MTFCLNLEGHDYWEILFISLFWNVCINWAKIARTGPEWTFYLFPKAWLLDFSEFFFVDFFSEISLLGFRVLSEVNDRWSTESWFLFSLFSKQNLTYCGSLCPRLGLLHLGIGNPRWLTEYLRLTLVFVWNGAQRENFIFYFSRVFF